MQEYGDLIKRLTPEFIGRALAAGVFDTFMSAPPNGISMATGRFAAPGIRNVTTAQSAATAVDVFMFRFMV
jgi:hypothetical protein